MQSSQILGDAIPWLKWVTYVSGFYAYMKKVKFNLDEFLQEFLDLKKVVAVENYEAAESKVEDFVDVLLAQPNETGTGNLDDDSIKGVVQVSHRFPRLNYSMHLENLRVNVCRNLILTAQFLQIYSTLFKTHFTSYTKLQVDVFAESIEILHCLTFDVTGGR